MTPLCFFLSNEPLTEEEKKGRYGSLLGDFVGGEETFALRLCQIPWTKECACCCISMLCFCPAQMYLRKKALNHIEPNSGWSNYICCQGYFPGCLCLQPGECQEESCPCVCMFLESCLCPGLAISATSYLIREQYQLGLDQDDVCLIRCTNCLQVFSCCCSVVAVCLTDNEIVDVASCVIGYLADAVFCSVAGCMTAQCNHEINWREEEGHSTAPAVQVMEGREHHDEQHIDDDKKNSKPRSNTSTHVVVVVVATTKKEESTTTPS